MNWKLVLSILSSINGGFITGAALFNPILGQELALKFISGLGILQIIVSSLNSNLSTQANTVKEVAAYPGVQKITVNEQANSTLAAIAIDPKADKIAPTPAALEAVTKTAEG